MSKPIFFISIQDKNKMDRIDRYTIIFDEKNNKEEDIFSTNEYITYILDELLNKNLVNNPVYNINITEAKPGQEYLTDTLIEFCRHIIYHDKNINKWILSNKNEPDVNILNLLNQDISTKIILIGQSLEYIMKDDIKRNNIIDLISNYYHIKPDIALYTFTQHKEITTLYESLPNDKNKKITLILSDNLGISFIKFIIELFKDKKNVMILVKVDNDFYSVSLFMNEIIFKKVCLR